MFRMKVILIRFHFNGYTHWDFIHKLKSKSHLVPHDKNYPMKELLRTFI